MGKKVDTFMVSYYIYAHMLFTSNNELYQIETRGQNQLHLFPTRTISARYILKHPIPDLLHEYPRAIIQRANTHSIKTLSHCSRHILLDLILIYVLISIVIPVDTMLGDFCCSNCMYQHLTNCISP